MKLDIQDMQTISAYIRLEQPDYHGAVFINLQRLEQLHMYKAFVIANLALIKAARQRA